MIYVPDTENYKCFNIYSESVIRAYEEVPTYNTTVNYRDYYIRSNYIYKDGTQSFSNYSTIPVCLASSGLTTDVYYRNDFDSILVIFFIMFIFCFYIPINIFVRLFRRFK